MNAITRKRVVVITGASAGIGRAAARYFGAKGWCVGLLARGEEGLQAARSEIESMGGEAMLLIADVADEAQVEAAAQAVEQRWGGIDAWINNAMVTLYCEVLEASPEQFRRATEVTYLGTVWGTQSALRRMQKRNAGAIVQVGSALAYRSIPLQSAYCGAKSAVRAFTDSLRSELIRAKSGVRISMVQLSAFNTPQFDWSETCLDRKAQPLPPIFQPEIAAQAIYYAATHRRRELWVGWPAVKAILGQRVMPGLLDRIAAQRGHDGQISNEPLPEAPQSILFRPVSRDHGAHGRFDDRAISTSWQHRLNTHRFGFAVLAIAAAALAARVVGGVLMRRTEEGARLLQKDALRRS